MNIINKRRKMLILFIMRGDISLFMGINGLNLMKNNIINVRL